MNSVISKAAIHCIGSDRDGYDQFLQRINAAGRQLAVIKVRDDLGAIDKPLEYWPDIPCVGAFTEFDGFPFDFPRFAQRASLKPQIKIWEVLNEINGEWVNQADFYIILAPLFAARGWSLCMFNCASGTPQYPWIDPVPYAEIARACKWMIDNGFKAYLGLHEYQLNSDTIGRFKVLADYLEQRGALLPIIITEYGFETHPGDAQFLEMAKANDPIYMTDRRVIGCALWTLGGGGWAQSNYETALPQLGEYIATVGDQSMPVIFGAHSPAHAGDITSLELQGIQQAGKFNGYKFQTGDTPTHYAQVLALGIPAANCITRLAMDFHDRPKPTAAQFCDDMRLAIDEAMDVGVTWFELHNEPNLGPAYGSAAEWPYSDDPHDFILWALEVIPLLHQQHPGIKIISPGLSPQPNTPLWWAEMAEHSLFDACDAKGAHAYFARRSTAFTQADGLNFIPLESISPNKPIFLTEYSNNQNINADGEKGAQYVDYASYLSVNHPQVQRMYLYVLSSETQSDNDTRQTLVRAGAVTDIVRGIHDTAFTTPTPTPDLPFSHWHVNGIDYAQTKGMSVTVGSEPLTIEAVYQTIPLTSVLLKTNPPGLESRITQTPAGSAFAPGTILNFNTT